MSETTLEKIGLVLFVVGFSGLVLGAIVAFIQLALESTAGLVFTLIVFSAFGGMLIIVLEDERRNRRARRFR